MISKLLLSAFTALTIIFSAFLYNQDAGTMQLSSSQFKEQSVTPATDDNDLTLKENAIRFEIRANYELPITQEKIRHAQSLGDLIENFPSNWITKYKSVAISGTSKPEFSKSELLTEKQKTMLQNMELGNDINIKVNYQYKDPSADDSIQENLMQLKLTITPDKEAEYIGGTSDLIAYLNGEITEQLSNHIPYKIDNSKLTFTINEAGKLMNIRLSNSTGYLGTDELLINALTNAPAWRPAESATGKKVNQDFILYIYNSMSGC